MSFIFLQREFGVTYKNTHQIVSFLEVKQKKIGLKKIIRIGKNKIKPRVR